MDTAILDFLISQGVFALLFGYLLFYVLKTNSSRETKYQELLQELTELLPDIKQNIIDIKSNFKPK